MMIIAALLAAFQALDVTSKAPVSLPPLPRGTSLTLHEEFSNNEYDFGGSVWPAAELLCRWLIEEEAEMKGARVLELGSGTGAVGLFAAAIGASHVTLTDGGGPDLLKLLEENVEHNRPLLGDASVDVDRLTWGDMAESCLAADQPYTHILAADVLYGIGDDPTVASADASDRCEALAATLEALLLCAPDGVTPPRVIMAYTYRHHGKRGSLPFDMGDDVLEHFLKATAMRSLQVRELKSERPVMMRSVDAENVWSNDMVVFEVGA